MTADRDGRRCEAPFMRRSSRSARLSRTSAAAEDEFNSFINLRAAREKRVAEKFLSRSMIRN
jgi:hypothetical protein